MDARRTSAKAIGDRQGPAPSWWSNRTAHGGEQGLRVTIRNGQHGNLGDRGSIFDRQALRVGGGADTRRKRIAGIKGHVCDAAALHALSGTVSALRKNGALGVSVVMRIGIDQAADRAVLGGNLGLDAAPGTAITGDHDCALYGNTVRARVRRSRPGCHSSRKPAAR